MRSQKNNPKKAVALQYKEARDRAPKISATGTGDVAKKILEVAKEANIPIQEDSDLIEVLAKIPLGEEIPPELYQAVAEILDFVYRLSNRYRDI